MATKPKTWELKVPLHCPGCEKDVKKVLQKIEGVDKVTTDFEQQKATVEGTVDLETLIKILKKKMKKQATGREKKKVGFVI